MQTHLGGVNSEPDYCLRLDDFDGNTDTYTFECDGTNGANVDWYYDGTDRLVIAGQIYGGVEDGNNMWQSPKVWNIYAVYTGVAPVGNTFDDATSTTTDVVLYVFDNTQLFEYNGRTGADSSSNTLIAKLDERTNEDPRAAEQYTVTGYLALSGETRFGGAWLALLDCEPGVDEPEDPFKDWCCTCSEFGVDRQCFPETILDPSGGACGTQGVLQCQALAEPMTCDDCQGQDPQECRPFNGTAQGGLLVTRENTGATPPEYCLRIDNLLSGTQMSPEIYTFECDDANGNSNGAFVEWYYDGADRLVIAGTIYGGLDIGTAWDNPELWNLYAVYTGVAPVAGVGPAITEEMIVEALSVWGPVGAPLEELYTFDAIPFDAGVDDATLRAAVDVRNPNNVALLAEHYTIRGFFVPTGEERQDGVGRGWFGLMDCAQGVDEPEDPTKNWCCDYPRQGIQRECLQSFANPSDGQTIVCQQVETCDECVPYTECMTDDECDPCGVCSEQGMCLIDDSQRDECGKCPGQSGFGECKIIGCSAAFGDCVTANGINVPEALDDIEARIQALETPPSPPPTENL